MTALDPTTWLPGGGLGASLEHRIASGGKCLVPYLTGGLDDWTTTLSAGPFAVAMTRKHPRAHST